MNVHKCVMHGYCEIPCDDSQHRRSLCCSAMRHEYKKLPMGLTSNTLVKRIFTVYDQLVDVMAEGRVFAH